MKNVLMTGLIIFIGIILILLAGCDNFILPPPSNISDSGETDVNLDWAIDDFSSNFAKAVFLTAKTVADSLELAQSTGVNFNEIQRSARFRNSEIKFSDLGPYLNGRTSGARSINGTLLSLEDEIAQIAENYKLELQKLILSPDFALISDFIAIEDDDILLIGGAAYTD